MKASILHRAGRRAERSWLLTRKRAMQRLRNLNGGVRKQVTFVAGVQRSGTTMLTSVLERSQETDVYRESDPRAFDEFEMRPEPTIHGLVRDSSAPHVVFKALCELQKLRSLLDEFDPAKAIWIVRDVDDVVNSHLALWTGMPWSIGQIVADRNGAAGWRGHGMSDETHAFVTEMYRPDISNATACALFWYFRSMLFFEQQLDTDPRVHLVRYEQLVADPPRGFESLFEFLGLRYASRLTRQVFAHSVKKRAAPPIDHRVRERCVSLAQRFAALGRWGP